MIATASKYVNARIGRPSVNAPNPKYLIPGEKVNIKSRVIGDPVNGNYTWYLTEENELFTAEGFPVTEEMRAIPFYADQERLTEICKVLKLYELWNLPLINNLKVGIIDNGVNEHDAIKQPIINLNPKFPIEDKTLNHGTTMACIIAGNDPNKNVIGMAPFISEIYSYTLPKKNATHLMIIDALNLLEEKEVKLINISYTTIEDTSNDDLQRKITDLSKKGFIIVCSTGNHYNERPKYFPAAYENVISVTGIQKNLMPAIDYDFWEGVSISMFADHYFERSIFKLSNGTSSACALITGCIACTYEILTGNKPDTLKNIFKKLPIVSFSNEKYQAEIPRFDSQTFIKLIKLAT